MKKGRLPPSLHASPVAASPIVPVGVAVAGDPTASRTAQSEVRADEAELAEYRRRFEDLLSERAVEMREAAARVRQEADERRRAETDLRTSEERFRMLVERSSDLTLIVDEAGRVSYCSPSVERLMGYRPDEIVGKVADELILADDVAQIAARRSRAGAGPDGGTDESPGTGTLRARTKGGSVRWFEWSASSHRNAATTGDIVVNARDVTERVLAERALRAGEERYRSLTEASPDMIYVVGADGRVEYVNGLAAARFGRPPEELVGTPLATLFGGATAARTVTAVAAVLASGEPHESDSLIAYPGGERWVRTRLVPLSNEGHVLSVLGVSHDITDRRLAQVALAQSEERYRSLFENSPVALWEEDHSAVKVHLERLVASGVGDVVGYLEEHPEEYRECVALIRTLNVNGAAVALCEAASRAELIDREDELYPPGANTGLPLFWAAALAGRREASYEQTGMTLTGRELRVLETCTVAPGHEETLDRVYVANVDITERRRAEELLARYQTLATEARDIMLFVRATDGRIVEANAAAEAAYGYRRDELLRLDVQALRGPAEGPPISDQFAAAGAGGILFETVHRRKDGSTFPVEVSSRGTIASEGDEVFLSVIRDITDRRQAAGALAHATARLLSTSARRSRRWAPWPSCAIPIPPAISAVWPRCRARSPPSSAGAPSASNRCARRRCCTTSARSSCRGRSSQSRASSPRWSSSSSASTPAPAPRSSPTSTSTATWPRWSVSTTTPRRVGLPRRFEGGADPSGGLRPGGRRRRRGDGQSPAVPAGSPRRDGTGRDRAGQRRSLRRRRRRGLRTPHPGAALRLLGVSPIRRARSGCGGLPQRNGGAPPGTHIE